MSTGWPQGDQDLRGRYARSDDPWPPDAGSFGEPGHDAAEPGSDGVGLEDEWVAGQPYTAPWEDEQQRGHVAARPGGRGQDGPAGSRRPRDDVQQAPGWQAEPSPATGSDDEDDEDYQWIRYLGGGRGTAQGDVPAPRSAKPDRAGRREAATGTRQRWAGRRKQHPPSAGTHPAQAPAGRADRGYDQRGHVTPAGPGQAADDTDPGTARGYVSPSPVETDHADPGSLSGYVAPARPGSIGHGRRSRAAESPKQSQRQEQEQEQARRAHEAQQRAEAEQERLELEARQKAKAEQERLELDAHRRAQAEQERREREDRQKAKAEQERLVLEERKAARAEKAQRERQAREAKEQEKAEQKRRQRAAREQAKATTRQQSPARPQASVLTASPAQEAVSQPVTPQRTRSSRRGRPCQKRKLLWLAISALLVVLAVAVAATAVLLRSSGGVRHILVTPNTIGAYAQAPALAQEMKAEQLKSGIVARSSGEATHVVDAVYEDVSGPAAQNGPQIVLFIGGNLSGTSAGSFISSFIGKLQGAVTANPGSLSGEAACVPSEDGRLAECAWADNDTFGVIASPTLGAAGLAKELRQMRPAVERVAK
jgi:hypothetical protein